MDECLTYFRQAIEDPASVPRCDRWYADNEELVRRVFPKVEVARLRHAGLRAAAVILKRHGWRPPPSVLAEQRERPYRWLLAAAVANWWACGGLSAMLGGTAGRGYAAAGRYFVMARGRYTEVTAEQWYISLIYDPASVAWLFVAFLLCLWNHWFRAKPADTAPGRPSPDHP
ncbi:MAG: hypothetical protein K2X82_02240 [Gemmataceae bacterium]|nr:hypothetical protein [Gemmataceae bacterium]